MVPAGGDSCQRWVPLIPSCHRAIPSRCPPCVGPLSTSPAGSPKASPSCEESSSAATPISVPQHTNLTCSEPASPCCGGPIISQTPTRAISNRIFDAHPRLRTAWDALQELYQLYEAEDLDGANQALGRFADSTPPARHREYHQVVDTIIAWGEQILAYHTTRRVSNGPIEGTNNLLQVLRRVAHGFTNYDNYAARGILVT